MEPRTASAPLEPTRTAVGGRFGKFRPEEEKSSRKAEVKENEAVRQMKAAWRACRLNYYKNSEDNYRVALQIVKNLRYTAKNVQEFSLALAEFQHEDYFFLKAGIFMSALINSGKDSDYVIHTQHLAMPPAGLGFFNEKNIVVNGDAGEGVGFIMEGGSITVNGDAGNSVGAHMEDGSITVNGDVGDRVGSCMNGGSITVSGNVRSNVGEWMHGGTITIKGNTGSGVGSRMNGGEILLLGGYGSLGENLQGGRIYHKGKLIYPDG